MMPMKRTNWRTQAWDCRRTLVHSLTTNERSPHGSLCENNPGSYFNAPFKKTSDGYEMAALKEGGEVCNSDLDSHGAFMNSLTWSASKMSGMATELETTVESLKMRVDQLKKINSNSV